MTSLDLSQGLQLLSTVLTTSHYFNGCETVTVLWIWSVIAWCASCLNKWTYVRHRTCPRTFCKSGPWPTFTCNQIYWVGGTVYGVRVQFSNQSCSYCTPLSPDLLHSCSSCDDTNCTNPHNMPTTRKHTGPVVHLNLTSLIWQSYKRRSQILVPC